MTQAAKKDPVPSTVAEALAQFTPASLDEALLAFQADPPKVAKDAKVVSTRSEKTGKMSPKYDYTTLQELRDKMRPKLTGLGLLWTTKPGTDAEGKPVVLYRCTHVPSGQSDEGAMPMVGSGGTMQGLGSSFSFARRYAEIIYFGLAPDTDEDAAGPTAEAEAARTKGPAADKAITKARAEQLLAKAKTVKVLPRMQVAASKAAGFDVGECDTAANAVKAMRKLKGSQADTLEAWLDEKAQEALDAEPNLDQADAGEQQQIEQGDAS